MERVSLQDYDCPKQALACLGQFIDEVYNQKRLHSSLEYKPPAEYEDELLKANRLARS